MHGNASSASAAAAQREPREISGWPPLPVLAVLLATIGTAIYVLVDDDGDGKISLSPQ